MKICRYLMNRRLTHCLLNLGLAESIGGCGPAAIVDEANVSLSLLKPTEVDSHLKDTRDTFKIGQEAPDYLVLEMEKKIERLCGVEGPAPGTRPQFSAIILGVAGSIVESTVSFIFANIKESLKDTLETYTSTYKGQQAGYFYAPRTSEKFRQAYTCIRLKREFQNDENNKHVLDFIAQIRVMESSSMPYNAVVDATFTDEAEKEIRADFQRKSKGLSEEELDQKVELQKMRKLTAWVGSFKELEYLVVTPLRLAVNVMAAESKNRQFTLSIGLKTESTWFQENVARQMSTERPILTTEFKLPDSGQVVKYYFKDVHENRPEPVKAETVAIFPGIPYSTGYLQRRNAGGSGMTQFELAVAEVGVPSKLLKAAIAIFETSSDDLAGLVSDALKKKWELNDE